MTSYISWKLTDSLKCSYVKCAVVFALFSLSLPLSLWTSYIYIMESWRQFYLDVVDTWGSSFALGVPVVNPANTLSLSKYIDKFIRSSVVSCVFIFGLYIYIWWDLIMIHHLYLKILDLPLFAPAIILAYLNAEIGWKK